MESHITFHASEQEAATQAQILRGRDYKVALAGPCEATSLYNDGDFPVGTVEGVRWIVLATRGELYPLP